MIPVNVEKISYHPSSRSYAVLLKEENSEKVLPILVGSFEAQSIALAIEVVETPRPLTHDLFLSIAEKSDLLLDKIIIHKLEKGIFFSSITFFNKTSNKSFIIDARTSDAIAIAIRFNASIYTYKKILEKANNYLKDQALDTQEEPPRLS